MPGFPRCKLAARPAGGAAPYSPGPQGDAARALRRYESALKCLSSTASMTDEEKEQAKQSQVRRRVPQPRVRAGMIACHRWVHVGRLLQLACHSNMAQCHLKLKQYTKARDAATKALELDKDNVKVWFLQQQRASLAGWPPRSACRVARDRRSTGGPWRTLKAATGARPGGT